MKIFIISLKNNPERRISIDKQLKDCNLNYSFFDAIDGRKIHHSLFDKYNEKKSILRNRRPLSGGEKGCYASHYLLWEKCIDINEPIVILEDDCHIKVNFEDALSKVSKVINTYNFIRLQEPKKGTKHKVASFDQFSLNYFTKYPYGTMGYVISPVMAQKLIIASKEFIEPVDVMFSHFWEHKQAMYGLSPHCIQDSAMAEHSNLEEGRESLGQNNNLLLKISRFSYKISNFIAKHKFNFKMLLRLLK